MVIQRYFSLFLNDNVCRDPSLELSWQEGSNDGHNICFKEVIWKIIPKLSSLPLLIWCTEAIPFK